MNQMKLNKDKQLEFRDFYQKTFGKIMAFAFKHAPDRNQAEDIVQSAYVRVWENFDSINTHFFARKSYLYTTVRNLVIKEYQTRLKEAEISGELLFNNEEVDDTGEMLIEKVNLAVKELPQKQQLAFELVKFHGLTYREAANEMGISESTLEKHIIKALRTLREKLSQFAYTILL